MSAALIAVLAGAAGVGVGALVAVLVLGNEARREREHARHLGRLHMAASARLYEREQHLRAERRRVDALLMRLAREQGRSEQVAQTALEVATLAQLDALWPDSRPAVDAGAESGANLRPTAAETG